MHPNSLQVYHCLFVMEFMLRVGFAGPQRCGSGWFRRCLSLVLRCYDIILAYINALLLLFYKFTNQGTGVCIKY